MSEHLPHNPEQEPHLISGRTVEDWAKFLTTHDGEPAGHLAAPGSRYGRTADECAPWAIALLAIYEANGTEPEEAEAVIDGAMSAVVNDHEEVAELIREYKYLLPPELAEELEIGDD